MAQAITLNGQPAQFTTSYIAANGSVTIKTTAGYLHAITINTKGGNSNTITVYDANSTQTGTVAVIDSTVVPGTFFYDTQVTTGLTVVTASGTAAAFTVIYR